MPLPKAFFAASSPIVFAPFTFADKSFAADLLTVEAAAIVTPASSSMNWTWMFSLVKQTAMRGQSFVPLIFLRMRQRRNCFNFCFFSVLISVRPRIVPWTKLLLDRLAFLALDVFADIAHALALVRLRRIKRADFRRDLADNHLVRAFDGQLCVFLDRHLDLVGNVVIHRMRITERKVHHLARDGGLETDALDLQLLDKTFGDALDHVVDERAAQAMQRLRLRVFAVAADDDVAALDLEARALRQFPSELGLPAFDGNVLPLHLHFDLRLHGKRLCSNFRHEFVKLLNC